LDDVHPTQCEALARRLERAELAAQRARQPVGGRGTVAIREHVLGGPARIRERGEEAFEPLADGLRAFDDAVLRDVFVRRAGGVEARGAGRVVAVVGVVERDDRRARPVFRVRAAHTVSFSMFGRVVASDVPRPERSEGGR